ncbi:MAG: hypothetical protein NC429_04800 [Lachnospiraceae bacterium]|nr:hypothetical protein [Lachnospiraceae bacterium]
MVMIMEDYKVKLGEQELSYRRGFKWYALPYEDITHAYLRIEEVRSKLCCAMANLDMHFLVLKTKKGELLKLEASSKESVKRMLDELKQKNPDVSIGFKKESPSED